ncbi:MAG: hypothetical protein GY953_27150, partial [bacterium]|nr:hypothetical protein [bacterium]
MLADAWCAAFVWLKVDDLERAPAITEEEFRKIEKNPLLAAADVRAEIRRLAEEYRFFHWHLAFPGVLRVDE